MKGKHHPAWWITSLLPRVSLVPRACCVTLCVLLYLPSFVRLKTGAIYPGPKATVRFCYCKKLLQLVTTYDTGVMRVTNRMQPKERRNRRSNLWKSVFPLLTSPTMTGLSRLPKCWTRFAQQHRHADSLQSPHRAALVIAKIEKENSTVQHFPSNCSEWN